MNKLVSPELLLHTPTSSGLGTLGTRRRETRARPVSAAKLGAISGAKSFPAWTQPRRAGRRVPGREARPTRLVTDPGRADRDLGASLPSIMLRYQAGPVRATDPRRRAGHGEETSASMRPAKTQGAAASGDLVTEPRVKGRRITHHHLSLARSWRPSPPWPAPRGGVCDREIPGLVWCKNQTPFERRDQANLRASCSRQPWAERFQ